MFSEAECEFLIDDIKTRSKTNIVDSKILRDVMAFNKVSVDIPVLPHETQEGLLTKCILNIIDQKTFKEYSAQLSGIPDYLVNRENIDDNDMRNVLYNIQSSILKGTPFTLHIAREKTEGRKKRHKESDTEEDENTEDERSEAEDEREEKKDEEELSEVVDENKDGKKKKKRIKTHKRRAKKDS